MSTATRIEQKHRPNTWETYFGDVHEERENLPANSEYLSSRFYRSSRCRLNGARERGLDLSRAQIAVTDSFFDDVFMH